jgi:glycosyltransferase involved in cell wall biosynthesis
MKPRVSVIIPAFNRERTIERAVQSALSQRCADVEVIVVDDGSTDGTLQKLKAFDDKIVVIRQQNAGPGAARNRGIEAATGEYIAFLDSDDEWLPGKLQRQLDIFNATPEVGLVAGSARCVDEEGQFVEYRVMNKRGNILEEILYINFVITSTVLLRAEILKPLRQWFKTELKPAEDFELWVRLSARHHFEIIPDILINYELSRHALTSQHPIDTFEALYHKIYAGFLNDEMAGAIVKAHSRRLEANIQLLVAAQYYQRGLGFRARKKLLHAFWLAPLMMFRPANMTMFLLPLHIRDLLRHYLQLRKQERGASGNSVV